MVTVSRSNGISIKGIKKLDSIIKWVDAADEIIDRPKTFQPLIVVGFAGSIGYRTTYKETGPLTSSESHHAFEEGRWQALAEITEEIREERGYRRSDSGGSILVQSGQLMQSALIPFQKWGQSTRRSSRSFNAPYGNHHNIKMTASLGNRIFRAQISGARVQNQYGGNIRLTGKATGRYNERSASKGRAAHLPARPFWYFEQGKMDNATRLFTIRFGTEWAELARTMGLLG